MACSKFEIKLIGYLNRELSANESKEVEMHIAICESCQKELAELKKFYSLTAQFKPLLNFPHPADEFLSQVRCKIRNLNAPVPKQSILPKLIPIFSTAAMILIVVIVFSVNRSRNNTVAIEQGLSSLLYDNTTSASLVYDTLDNTTQDLVNNELINGLSLNELQSVESELVSTNEPADLMSEMSENEKEFFINEILNQYQEAQDKINPDWVENPGGTNG